MKSSEEIIEISKSLLDCICNEKKNKISHLLKLLFNKKFSGNHLKNNEVEKFFEKISYTCSDCWFWIGCLDSGGYGVGNYKGKNQKAHRISWCLHNGTIPENKNVLHLCDERSCVNPKHLFLGTQLDNVLDMCKKGRQRTGDLNGDKNPMSKLTEDKVLLMRKYRKETKKSYAEIAREFGVSSMTAYRAIKNISWRSI